MRDESRVRIVCLGNPHAGDDAAALRAADLLESVHYEVIRAGRPGAGLLDVLSGERPVVLVDATFSGATPGSLLRLGLQELPHAALARPNVSSHGFGPAQALELARALGQTLPPGKFVGVEGQRFEPGETLSAPVLAALPSLVAAVREDAQELEREHA